MNRGDAAAPSRWSRRVVIAVIAAAGFATASYLASYQFGFVKRVWEPLFGNGSQRVLHSFVSRLLPLPDAALGAIAYFVELIATLLGASDRYRTHPQLVLCYGAVVAAAAATAVALVVVQLLVIRAACTLCLCSAAMSLVIAYLASDEIVAALARIYEERKSY